MLHRRGVLDDPHAAGMLSPGVRVVARLPTPVARSPFLGALAARILWFDGQVVEAMDEGVDQIVIVGAGFDSRAWRLARNGVRFYELDHPATQAVKRRRAPAGDGPVYVAADLAVEPAPDALRRSDRFDPDRPALFVVEGVTMYLTEASVRSLLAGLAERSAPDSRLAVNFAAPRAAGSVAGRIRQRALQVLGTAGGERHVFFLHADDAAAFVASTGWSVTATTTLAAAGTGTGLRTDRLAAAAPMVAAVTVR